MPLAAAAKLGPYEIVAPVGHGGMGEVYRARDTRLERQVAIKVLPQSIVADSDRMRRFEQEARTIAALNHPNIVVVYDVGVQDGTSYLVMELLEGESLRERLDRGPIPVRKVVEIGSQMAYGLAAAHERGIVHRDLKPENVFLTKDGHTKLLDFGLAKTDFAQPSEDGKTVAMQTSPGVVMGTAPYMAPEQVRGEPLDYRADIFSFGAVLYEMLSGKSAFGGDSAVETMTAILKSDPPEFDPAAANIPPALDRIVRHCLEKNPKDRFQSARDLTFALGALSGSGSHSGVALRPALRQKQRRLLWMTGLLALVAGGLIAYFLARPAAPAERMEFAIATAGEVSHLALSADGGTLAYVAPDPATGDSLIFLQKIGSPTASRLEGTLDASYPFWSPDAKYLGFFANGKLKKIPAAGGVAEVLASADNGRGGSWGSKGVILYSPGAAGVIWKVNADGSGAEAVTEKPTDGSESSHRWPCFLPDGVHFLFWAGAFNQSPNDHHSGIYMESLKSRQRVLVLPAQTSIAYGAGRLFYTNEKRALMAASLNTRDGHLGPSEMVVSQVGRNPSTFWSAFTVADNGTVVYNQNTAAARSQLTWFDRSGKTLGTVGDSGVIGNPTLSPDGQRLAVDVIDGRGRNIDVWIYDLPRDTYTRFTFDPAEETNAAWSRDGRSIAFRSAAVGNIVRVKNADGLESEHGIASLSSFADMMPFSWMPDDKSLLVGERLPTGGSKLGVLSLADHQVNPALESPGNQTEAQLSPDGKWLAYASDETGDWEVYITPFPATGGKLQVSHGGGSQPRWRGDGKEIYYLGPSRTMMSVPVNGQGGLSTGYAMPLFQVRSRPKVSATDMFAYDVTADGKRFLVNQYVKPAQTSPLSIILHATTGLP